jgi:hemolysin III
VSITEVQLAPVTTGLRIGVDEIANGITHGLGLALSLVGTTLLLSRVWATGDAWSLAGCGIYGFSLIGVYAFSTLSHVVVPAQPRLLFRILDQAFIYLLVVGTYTPLAMSFLRTNPWWVFFAVMWLMALVGFVSKLFFSHRIEGVAIWIYVTMGWMLGLAGPALANYIPPVALWSMVIGGVWYTAGTYFLVRDYRRWYYHAVWHLFVIAGSVSHFFAILISVAPQA